jgi:Flp pilus assembly protein TadG
MHGRGVVERQEFFSLRVTDMRTRLTRNERGAALLETAVTLPIILLISVGIFEFGRAYQTWQVLTNAAREGARVAVIAGTTDDQVRTAVRAYMIAGNLAPDATINAVPVDVDRTRPLGDWTGSAITISYPFEFIVLNPVIRLIDSDSTTGAPLTMSAFAIMRNEG